MDAADDHPVPSGPLAVRWLAYELPAVRAGALAAPRVALENAGTAAWVPTGPRRVCLAYHWLDELGNPIVWDGLWTALPHEVPAAGRARTHPKLRRPHPPRPHRLAVRLAPDDRHTVTPGRHAAPQRQVPART